MVKAIPPRTWATPLTIGSFILMSISGLLMFLHWDTGLVAGAHQWVSLLFLLGVGGHVTANFRPFKNHLHSRWGQASVAIFVTVLAASVFSWGLVTGSQLQRPILLALADAPLSSLADITRTEPRALLEKLQARGITATSGQSIRELALTQQVDTERLLGMVFLPN